MEFLRENALASVRLLLRAETLASEMLGEQVDCTTWSDCNQVITENPNHLLIALCKHGEQEKTGYQVSTEDDWNELNQVVNAENENFSIVKMVKWHGAMGGFK